MFDLKIGFSCNNNCKHCVVADKKPSGDMPIENLYKILDSLPYNSEIQITGGEPSIYGERLLEVLKRCKLKNIKTCLQTNATGFSDKAFFDTCKNYIDHCHVAIHSALPEVHDFIVGTSGMWEKTIQGWKNILAAGIECSTQTVLSQYNMPSLLETYDFIQKEAPGIHMAMTYPHLMGNALKNHETVAFRYSDYKETIHACLKKYGKFIQTEAIPFCYLYPYENDLEWISEENILSGNEARNGIDFSDGYDSKNYNLTDLQGHSKAPLCSQCIYNTKCIGVWKEYIQLFKNSLDLYPIKEGKNGNNR